MRAADVADVPPPSGLTPDGQSETPRATGFRQPSTAYGAYWTSAQGDLLRRLETSRDGLSPREAAVRLGRYGPNTIHATALTRSSWIGRSAGGWDS